jgi:hypothetical protein
MRKLVVLCTAVAALGFAGAAEAKLTPVETKWAKPMISVWNEQNLALHVVIQAASAKNALVAGTTNNKRLTVILNTFVVCKSLIKKAGSPPSPRLQPFATALGAACTHDTSGATDFAKAVGAVGKGKGAQAQTLLKAGVAEFQRGTAALSQAKKSLVAVGGQNIFKA